MEIEQLFTAIKTKCDKLQLAAAGTGKPETFSVYVNKVQYRFTIGLKLWIGFEVFTVGAINADGLDKFSKDRLLMPSDVLQTVEYDAVNILLSGVLAAIYGTATSLQQLVENHYK
jgi:hypothetical protein